VVVVGEPAFGGAWAGEEVHVTAEGARDVIGLMLRPLKATIRPRSSSSTLGQGASAAVTLVSSALAAGTAVAVAGWPGELT